MSRAFNLALTESQAARLCRDRHIAISALEVLPDGGVRLVCASAAGAEQVRTGLKKHIIDGDVRRQRFRPVTPLW
jgi:hypothetical protein